MKDAQLNVYNLSKMRSLAPEPFAFIRFDPNNDCNVHCVYCHNHRSKEIVPEDELLRFLDENVTRLENFQMGCIMEPTLDRRLADMFVLVSQSKHRPTKRFILQTNGILLHMHDHARMREAGLNEVSVSIDAADPAIHKLLRGGTSIAKVGTNLAAFRKTCPEVHMHFITTVTRANIDAMDGLVRFGLDLGVQHFMMREVFYRPDSDVVDHSRMPDLVLRSGEFGAMAKDLRAAFGSQVRFDFMDNGELNQFDKGMKVSSFR